MASGCTDLSVISGYAITGATPYRFLYSWRVDISTLACLVLYICASVLEPENGSALYQVMTGRLLGAKQLPKMTLTYCQLRPWTGPVVSDKGRYKQV